MLKNTNYFLIPLQRLSAPLLCLLVATFIVSGCSLELHGTVAYTKGYLAWKRADLPAAVLHFYEAKDAIEKLPNKKLQIYTDFALASTYLMQGEDSAAAKKLQYISDEASEHVRAYCFYQRGIIAFRSNDYAEAASFFKKSLELSCDDIDAKINYELSKTLAKRQQEVQRKTLQSPPTDMEIDLTDSIIFDIIRKREHTEWAHLQHEVEPAVNDY